MLLFPFLISITSTNRFHLRRLRHSRFRQDSCRWKFRPGSPILSNFQIPGVFAEGFAQRFRILVILGIQYKHRTVISKKIYRYITIGGNLKFRSQTKKKIDESSSRTNKNGRYQRGSERYASEGYQNRGTCCRTSIRLWYASVKLERLSFLMPKKHPFLKQLACLFCSAFSFQFLRKSGAGASFAFKAQFWVRSLIPFCCLKS